MQEIEAPSVHAVQQMAVLDKLVRILIHPRTTTYGVPLLSPFIIHSPLSLISLISSYQNHLPLLTYGGLLEMTTLQLQEP
jgi:hypothetical protein